MLNNKMNLGKDKDGNDNTIQGVTFDKLTDKGEGLKKTPYYDSVGKPTIGYGVNLDIKEYRGYVFDEMGITESDHRKEYEEAISGVTSSKDKDLEKAVNDVYIKLNTNSTKQTFEISEDQAKAVFNTITEEKMKSLDKVLHLDDDAPADKRKPLLRDKESKEYVALLDMTYNGGTGLIGQSLKTALENDNRAEAWYEIRYNSNGGESRENSGRGIANRRVEESNFFGLYANKDNVTIRDAKETLRMYAEHKETIYKDDEKTQIKYRGIIDEEEAFPEEKGDDGDISKKNPYSGDNSISKQLDPSIKAIKDRLKDDLGEDIDIALDDITIGKGLEAYSYKEKSGTDDDIKCTDNNDVIFAQNGDDTIDAGKGDDIIYSGEGANTIIGGIGNDTYIYEKSDKGTLIINDKGDKEDTDDKLILKGFKFDDISFAQSADGKDLIMTFEDDEFSKVTIKNYKTDKGKIENFKCDDKDFTIDDVKKKIDDQTQESIQAQIKDPNIKVEDLIRGEIGDAVDDKEAAAEFNKKFAAFKAQIASEDKNGDDDDHVRRI